MESQPSHQESGPVDRWSAVLAFYRRLIDDHGWQQEPMFEFVSWLASSEYGRCWYPSTSHAALGLSLVPTYPERLRAPMVFVAYVGKQQVFEVHYQHAQSRTVRREIVPSPQSPDVLPKIVAWIGLPKSDPNRPIGR